MIRSTTTGTTWSKKALALGLLLALVVGGGLLMLVVSREAEAAFPGLNGKIAFHSNRTTGAGVDNPTGDYEIFTISPNSTNLKQLTKNTTNDFQAAWSADGQHIAFATGMAIPRSTRWTPMVRTRPTSPLALRTTSHPTGSRFSLAYLKTAILRAGRRRAAERRTRTKREAMAKRPTDRLLRSIDSLLCSSWLAGASRNGFR